MLRSVLVLTLVASACAQDIELGPESTIARDASGTFLVISDPRNKAEYLINLSRVVFIKAATANDNNSCTEIHLGLNDKDANSAVIRVQQRVIPYERIKQALVP